MFLIHIGAILFIDVLSGKAEIGFGDRLGIGYFDTAPGNKCIEIRDN